MIDPLAEVVALLQPSARFAKTVVGAGSWHIRRSDTGQPFYCVVLEGGCHLKLCGGSVELRAGDFALVPAAYDIDLSSLQWAPSDIEAEPVALGNNTFRIGEQEGPTDLRMLVGHCRFGSPDAALLVSLLPRLIHIHDDRRLSTLVELLGEESRESRPAREVVLARLLEVLFIEALRSTADSKVSVGLVRGLADMRLAPAIRAMHEHAERAWTVAELAKEASLSRSTFFERFRHTVGVAPMAYLLAWRMARAKQLLRQNESSIASISEQIGYSSASTFSVAFTRHVGLPPKHYARNYTKATASRGPKRSEVCS